MFHGTHDLSRSMYKTQLVRSWVSMVKRPRPEAKRVLLVSQLEQDCAPKEQEGNGL